MKKEKAPQNKLLTGVICVIFLPFILLFLAIFGIIYIAVSPREKKKYKESAYFKKFGYPYGFGITNRPGFMIEEAIKEGSLDAEIISLENGETEFLRSKDTLYIIEDLFTFAADGKYGELYVAEGEGNVKRTFTEAFEEEIARDIYDGYRDLKIRYLVSEETSYLYMEEVSDELEDHTIRLIRADERIALVKNYSAEVLREII